MPSHESNPITAIARTRGVARWDDYKHIHVPEPVSFGFVVIHHLIRLPQHAIVAKKTAILECQQGRHDERDMGEDKEATSAKLDFNGHGNNGEGTVPTNTTNDTRRTL